MLNRCVIHSSARKPWARQSRCRAFSRDKRTNAGWESEDLVGREDNKVCGYSGEPQSVGRKKCRGVEQHFIPARMSNVDQVEWMFDSGEIRLRRKTEKARSRISIEVRLRFLELQIFA